MRIGEIMTLLPLTDSAAAALNLAVEWKILDRHQKFACSRVSGKRKGSFWAERKDYLAACRQPWRDIATVILGTG